MERERVHTSKTPPVSERESGNSKKKTKTFVKVPDTLANIIFSLTFSIVFCNEEG